MHKNYLKENSYLFKEFSRQSLTQLTVMSTDATAVNDPMRQQRLTNITCNKCSQKAYYRKDCPSSAGTSLVPENSLTMPRYSPPTTVTRW